jgi:putative ABC transport system permease protein
MTYEEAAYARLLDSAHPALLVGSFQALKDGLKQTGKHIMLQTPSGPVDFEIVGVTLATPATLAEPAGAFVMDRDLYSRLWQDNETDRLLIKLQPGADVQAERRDLLRRYALSGLLVTDRETLRATVAGPSLVPASFAYGLALPFMMLGVANTLFIAVLDRRREIGLLRAIGTLRRHIVLSVVLEALILIGLTCIFAVPASYYTLDIMLFRRIVGIPITADVGSVAMTVILVLVAGGIAAYFPARRAGRADILEALHYE